MLMLAVLAAATLGAGTLTAAPSASAMPKRPLDCGSLRIKMNAALDLWTLYAYIGDQSHADYYHGLYRAYSEVYFDSCSLGVASRERLSQDLP
jgi:hypothetical protein